MRYGLLEHSGSALSSKALSSIQEGTVDTSHSTDEIKMKKILLIDLENCPNQIHDLQDSLKEYSRVVICYASTGAKIPLDWLVPLNETINASRLQIHKMDKIGKNAADFGIFFFAGMLAQQLDEAAEFTIASDDTDLDHLVSLLENLSHKVKREGKEKITALPAAAIVVPAVPIIKDVAAGVKLYCEHLERYSGNRPASEQTLRNSIRTRMAQNIAMTEAVLEQLIKLKALSLSGTKVVYQPTKIHQLANTTA